MIWTEKLSFFDFSITLHLINLFTAILYDTGLHPQNIGVMATRSEPMDINFQPLDINDGNVNNKFGDNIAAIILQYPNTEGLIYEDLDLLVQYAHKEKVKDNFEKIIEVALI